MAVLRLEERLLIILVAVVRCGVKLFGLVFRQEMRIFRSLFKAEVEIILGCTFKVGAGTIWVAGLREGVRPIQWQF